MAFFFTFLLIVEKFTAIQQRIKASLVLVSRSRFKVLVPYNACIIEIFKKMPSKCYGKLTYMYMYASLLFDLSFQMPKLRHGVSGSKITELLVIFFFALGKFWCSLSYAIVFSIVDTLKKECKFVDLSLIPKPVISMFQRLKQRKGPIPNPPSAGMDWSRVEAKLSSTLMQFQRDGVEYVHRVFIQ
jgi:hypothetical protein